MFIRVSRTERRTERERGRRAPRRAVDRRASPRPQQTWCRSLRRGHGLAGVGAQAAARIMNRLHRLKSGLRQRICTPVCRIRRAAPNIRRVLPPFGRHFHDSGQPLHAAAAVFAQSPNSIRRRQDHAPRPAEPANVARMAAEMGLRYRGHHRVNRDDLEDGGSHHFAETVREVRRAAAGKRAWKC